MAHPCSLCEEECHCSGDIDDAVLSLTPASCQGCEDCQDDDDDNDWSDDDDDFDDYFACPLCSLCLSGGEACGDYPECQELWP